MVPGRYLMVGYLDPWEQKQAFSMHFKGVESYIFGGFKTHQHRASDC